MKVCLVASSYPRFPGDIAGVFVHSLARAISDLGHSVRVLAPYDPRVRPLEDTKVSVTHFRYLPVSGWHAMGYGQNLTNDRSLRKTAYFQIPFYLTLGSLALARLAREEKFDLINAHWVVPNGPLCLLACRLTDTPLIITLHGSDVFVAERFAPATLLARYAFRASSAVTTCSDELKEKAIALGAPPERTSVIPWGVNSALFDGCDGARWRDRLDLAPHQPVILSAGRMVEKKGFEHLVRAAPRILSYFPEARFVVGGDGPLLHPMKQLARHLGVSAAFRFPGLIPWDQMPSFLASGDLFVAPSIHDDSGNVDGLPTVVLEAVASGVPVVATRVGGLPMVVDHGETGLLVAEGDRVELAEAIKEILGSPAKMREMGVEARRRAVASFSWERVAREYVSIFETTRGVSS